MSYMRKIIAIWLSKLAVKLSKLFGGQGSATAGAVALKICPDILNHLVPQVKKDIVIVTGTNGKTTTNNMIYSMLKLEENKVVCNNAGANMLTGIVTAFVDKTSINGKLNADYACIEVDEASLRRITKFMQPNYLVVNNIFRDQLDRYGEIDITFNLIKEAIDSWNDVKLILNADDPLVAQFGKKVQRDCIYYGIDKLNVDYDKNETKEGRFCSFCGHVYEYEYYHYSQLGKYKCENCGFERPVPDFEASEVDLSGDITFTVYNKNNENPFNVKINYKGLYNIHNSMAAIATAKTLEIANQTIVSSLGKFKPQAGRMEKFTIEGKDVILNLSKNPAGFNQAIDTVMKDEKQKNIIITINDNAQDGKDISWLWDVEFERFKNIDDSINVYIISGTRKEDMALRLKYAGISTEKIRIDGHLEDSVEAAIRIESDIVYSLINYTALFDVRKILEERAVVKV